MRAIVWHGPNDLRFEDVPVPAEPRAGEVLVSVSHCGICGTDIAEYAEGPLMIRPGRHPLTAAQPPIVLGHEFSGTVEAVGADVDASVIGQSVTVDPCWRCNTCYWCLRGDYHLCKLGESIGVASHGALAPIVRVPAVGLVPLPDSIDNQVAALVEPLAVGLHAIQRGRVKPGEKALILGFGPIGAAVLLAARAAGIVSVYVSKPVERRRNLAVELGATEAFDPGTIDVRREIYIKTGRIGPDVVFECTGIPALVALGVEAARRGGRVVLVGIGHSQATLSPQQVVPYERELIGSLGYCHDLPRVIDLIHAGLIRPAALITGVVPIEEAIDGAFNRLLADRGEHMKILVEVSNA